MTLNDPGKKCMTNMCLQGKYLYSNGFRHDDSIKFDDYKPFFQTKLKKVKEAKLKWEKMYPELH